MAKNILREIRANLEKVIGQENTIGSSLWKAFLGVHPADIAAFIEDIEEKYSRPLFLHLPRHLKLAVFEEFSEPMKVEALSYMHESDQIAALNAISSDELTDLFDILSDEDLRKYLHLLHKKTRQEVLSLLKFDSESAGGIMEIGVLSLMEDFTIEKSIKLLQRIKSKQEIYNEIYVTDKEQHLAGYINLQDLLLHSPKTRISTLVKKTEITAQVNEDQETIAKKMIHYGLMTVPVIGSDGHFLGVIASETLVDVLVEEATEDVQKMSALTPMKQAYFDMPFLRMLYERSYILMVLLVAESFSGSILHAYESSLGFVLMSFIPMLVSTGGNISSQTSAVAIQGMASGEIRASNIWRFLRREFYMSAFLALILGFTAFGRVYYTTGGLLKSFAVSLSLASIVMLSVMLGSYIPIILKRLNIDPAFAAGPFLATVVDILGILIYCYLTKLILF